MYPVRHPVLSRWIEVPARIMRAVEHAARPAIRGIGNSHVGTRRAARAFKRIGQ